MKFNNNKKAGISLVALVITIIVMIILTGAVIVTFMDGGIIDRSREATFKSDIKTYQEMLIQKNLENQLLLETTPNAIVDEITLESLGVKEEYKDLIDIVDGNMVPKDGIDEKYSKWLGEIGIGGENSGESGNGSSNLSENAIAKHVSVGDYVDYKSTFELTGDPAAGVLATYEKVGYWTDTTSPINYKYDNGEEVEYYIHFQNPNWRVLKNDGNKVTLISETPIDSWAFSQDIGFFNGGNFVDETYNHFYGNTYATARGIRIEDINDALNIDFDINDETNWTYKNESNVEINLPKGVRTLKQFLNTFDFEHEELHETLPQFDNIELDYYKYYGIDYVNADTQAAYDLIFKTPDESGWADIFWTTTPAIHITMRNGSPDLAELNFRYVKNGYVGGGFIGQANNRGVGSMYKGRPVVILDASVEINPQTSGNGSSAATAWTIK